MAPRRRPDPGQSAGRHRQGCGECEPTMLPVTGPGTRLRLVLGCDTLCSGQRPRQEWQHTSTSCHGERGLWVIPLPHMCSVWLHVRESVHKHACANKTMAVTGLRRGEALERPGPRRRLCLSTGVLGTRGGREKGDEPAGREQWGLRVRVGGPAACRPDRKRFRPLGLACASADSALRPPHRRSCGHRSRGRPRPGPGCSLLPPTSHCKDP